MSQTLNASMLLAVPLAPLVGSALAGIWGTAFGGNKIGRTGSSSLTILGVLLSFLLSAFVFKQVVFEGATFNQTIYTWMQVGGLKMEVGFLIDSITAMMMCVVTFVSLMVHIYTMGYMAEDDGYDRFFSYISLFTFSMLMLVMANNLLQLFFGWEAVGLVSYLLIGFYYKKESAIFANMKAFLVNRVGDFGFILGIGLIAAYTGTLNYSEIFAKLPELQNTVLPGTGWLLVTVTAICLFVGAMGKSAQFPLHAWLPDSMEGPTPISALIHAATMVTAGIFMVSRMSPLYEMSDVALNLIVVIGSITALFMGILGIIQNDIKRVIAYSTLSQLGYMTIALGVSAYSVSVFHLMTHAFFKALLFLGAGSVIMGMHHNQDIRWMGGVRKYMPITWFTFLLGNLALIGTPFFSGFYSKDAIIEAVHASNLPATGFANFAVLAGVFITAFYSFRLYFIVFHGKERYDQNPDAHHDDHHAHDDHHGHGHDAKPHESPLVVTGPLMLLAIPSVVIGAIALAPMVLGDFFKGVIFVDESKHPAMATLRHEIHDWLSMALHGFTAAPFWLALAGVVTAYLFYMVWPAIPAKIMSISKSIGLYQVLEGKYGVDWVYENIFARGARAFGTLFWKVGDQAIIDGAIVNGSWKLMAKLGQLARRWQTGYLYHYALVMILGVFALMTYFVWLNK
ncbi:NADH-quinone oxidoreductase subunit L [Diaphorobacter caeni]|uniref:NADH-quinone oxidoreductase subunit L n=1 Tax=Diaphorobacter caeni TaxID=2784387 RepID=UPI00188F498D|nr:NADH-quinone oxidoreductase subunit L [Diaphorobacter caeni]MBF5003513.1 NADH-quinone oxidoreductase subunit L [Diaphorobacter caeni]